MTTHASTTIAQIAQLPNLSMENLWSLWDDLFDRRPGHHQADPRDARRPARGGHALRHTAPI